MRLPSVGARIDTAYAREIYARGVRLISYSADALVFLEACKQIAATRPVGGESLRALSRFAAEMD